MGIFMAGDTELADFPLQPPPTHLTGHLFPSNGRHFATVSIFVFRWWVGGMGWGLFLGFKKKQNASCFQRRKEKLESGRVALLQNALTEVGGRGVVASGPISI